ncbi:MAG: alpha/beta hydrolase [Chloroflexota bacterium]
MALPAHITGPAGPISFAHAQPGLTRAHVPIPVEAQVETFLADDGVELVLTRRRRLSRPAASRAVVVAPGLFTHREVPEHQALAERLVEIADVYTLDVRGHGASGGAFTWGVREPEDVATLARRLRHQYERVGGVGFSFGGYHVGTAAARFQAFDAVAMVATPRSFFIVDRHFLLRGIVRSIRAVRNRHSTLRRFSMIPPHGARRPTAAQIVSRIAPAPLLIAHGTGDWLLGTHHARELFARAVEPKSLLLVEGGSHAEGMMLAHAEQLARPLTSFLDRHL